MPSPVRERMNQMATHCQEPDDKPEVQARRRQQLWHHGVGEDGGRLRPMGDRVAPGSVQQRTDNKERDVVHQQGRHHLIHREVYFEEGGNQAPEHPGDETAHEHDQDGQWLWNSQQERYPARRPRQHRHKVDLPRRYSSTRRQRRWSLQPRSEGAVWISPALPECLPGWERGDEEVVICFEWDLPRRSG